MTDDSDIKEGVYAALKDLGINPETIKSMKVHEIEMEDGGRSRKREDRPRGALAIDVEARVLKDMLEYVQRPNPFKPGDLVQLQKERSTYRYPEEKHHHMGIVVKTYNRVPDLAPGREEGINIWPVNDMLILAQAKMGWHLLVVDSWRFEKYEGEIA